MRKDYSFYKESHYALRLPVEIQAELKALAESVNMPHSTLARELIQEGIKARQQKSAQRAELLPKSA